MIKVRLQIATFTGITEIPILVQPLWKKCPYTGIVPKILTAIPKSADKNIKNRAIASFHGEQSAHRVSKQVIDWFSRKIMPSVDANWGT